MQCIRDLSWFRSDGVTRLDAEREPWSRQWGGGENREMSILLLYLLCFFRIPPSWSESIVSRHKRSIFLFNHEMSWMSINHLLPSSSVSIFPPQLSTIVVSTQLLFGNTEPMHCTTTNPSPWLHSDQMVSFKSWLHALTRQSRFTVTTSESFRSLHFFFSRRYVLVLTSFLYSLLLRSTSGFTWCHNGRITKTIIQDSCLPELQPTQWPFGLTTELLMELQWTSCGFKVDQPTCCRLNNCSRPSSTRRLGAWTFPSNHLLALLSSSFYRLPQSSISFPP